MKISIEGLSQEMLYQYGYDCTDAVIIRYVIDFYSTGKMKEIKIEGKNFFWLKYKKILDDLPILNIGERAFYDRISQLCGKEKKREIGTTGRKRDKAALFEHYTERSDIGMGTRTYFRFIPEKLEMLLSSKENKSKALEENFRCAPEENFVCIDKSIKRDTLNTNVLREQAAAQLVASSDVSSFRETNKILLYWKELSNQFPGAQISNHGKFVKRGEGYSESKAYKDCINYLKRLQRGGFEDFKFDSLFLKRNSIKNSLLSEEWTEKEIKLNLKRLAILRIPGTLPFPDKNKIPKDLKTLIYNSVKGTSFFFAVAMHPPYVSGKGKTDEQINNDHKFKVSDKVMSVEEFEAYLSRIDAEFEAINAKYN